MFDTYEKSLLFLIYGTIFLFLIVPMIYRKRYYSSKKFDEIDLMYCIALLIALLEVVRFYIQSARVYYYATLLGSIAFILLNCIYGRIFMKILNCWPKNELTKAAFYGIYILLLLFVMSDVIVHHLFYMEGSRLIASNAFYILRSVFLLMMVPYGILAFVKMLASNNRDPVLHEKATSLFCSFIVLVVFDIIQIPYLEYEYSVMLPYTMSISFLALYWMAESRIKEVKKNVATQGEFDTARKIQLSLIPQTFSDIADIEEFELSATVNAAKELGGDFYDYKMLDEDHLMMVIADVSGYGLPAAIYMAVAKTLIKNVIDAKDDIEKIMELVNDRLCEDNTEKMFVTIWIGILEISTGELTCVNAGHEFPIISRAGGSFELYEEPHGFVVGVIPNRKYEPYVIKLNPGDRLFQYTDGIPEAINDKDELFGTEALLQCLNGSGTGDAQAIFDGVLASVKEFRGKIPQSDDITMMLLEYKGKKQ